MVRLAAYGGLSTAAAAYVVLSAFRQRSNFFAAAVYLSKSNASMMLLWNFGIFLTIIFGRAVQTVFFGPLRLIELERMHERVWYAITESLLALTIFREAFDTSFVILFVSLLFLKVFHWLASDRVEMMEQAPTIPRLFHMRMVTMLSLLWCIDVALVAVAADSILTEGPSVMIMFASEYMILLATLLGTTLKYGGNAYDLRNDIPWENKSVFTFYVELACDFLKLATYLCFFSLILTFYGLPLNILRDVYITARSFINKVRDLSRYRQATRNMDQRYPNATAEEMERLSDKTCIICREDMEARTHIQGETRDARQGPNDTPKKLPCGHIFHFHCLRSWLERQQSCPTCRRPVLSGNAPPVRPPQIPAPPAPAQAPAAQPLPHTPRATATGPNASVASSQSTTLPSEHLSLPPVGTQATSGSASNTARRRAGLENPLVAFQTRSASKGPTTSTSPGSIPKQANLLPTNRPSSSNAALPSPASKGEEAGQHNEGMKSSKPLTATQVAPSAMTDTDMQRQQRLEAALRRRGNQGVATESASANPADSLLQTTERRPTPTIKIDDASKLPTSTASSLPPTLAEGEASRSSIGAAPAALSNVRSQHISPYSSRASSPVTILDPMGAFGRRAVPQSTSSVMPHTPGLTGSNDIKTSSLPRTPSQIQTLPSADMSILPSLSSTDMPRLIPLFDPSDPTKPSRLTRFLPSLLCSGLWSADQQTTPRSQKADNMDMVHLPDDLDEGQLATLAEITREGLETRLKLLNSTQGTLQACISQLQKAMEVLDTEDVQGVLQVASELNTDSSNQPQSTVSESADKGKGRERAQ